MPHARRTDPQTSHEAAKSVTNVEKTKAAIWKLLADPLTDTELMSKYRVQMLFGDAPEASESGVRSRRAELVAEGMVEATGERRKTPSGRSSMVWVRTPLVEGCDG
jgi:hypothetical protein